LKSRAPFFWLFGRGSRAPEPKRPAPALNSFAQFTLVTCTLDKNPGIPARSRTKGKALKKSLCVELPAFIAVDRRARLN